MWWTMGGPLACCRGRALGYDLPIIRKSPISYNYAPIFNLMAFRNAGKALREVTNGKSDFYTRIITETR